MTRRPIVLALALTAAAAACVVQDLDLSGKACDALHPCVAGYACTSAGACVATGAADGASAGPDAGCAGASPFCRAGSHFACQDGTERVLAVCAGACDPARGCLSECPAAPTPCPAAAQCDRATDLCVPYPACGAGGQPACAAGSCQGGACVATSARAVVGASPADLACLGADAGVPATGTATIKGYVVDPTGKATPETIGLAVSIYRASEFDDGDSAQPLAATTAFDGGMATAEGVLGVGTYQAAGIPVGVDLVAATSGPGAVPTYQYFSVRAEAVQGGVADRQLVTSFSTGLWSDLLQGAAIGADARRGGVVGQVFDCKGAKVEGATVGLSAPARAFYTYPGVLGVDRDAAATSDNGRFLFFDVPALELTVAADLGGRHLTSQLRAKPGAVTLVNLRPAGR